ncbi:hypothetical protein [Nostoc sp. T09]|nr:hypothetical protein [Nostoc sp. T09]
MLQRATANQKLACLLRAGVTDQAQLSYEHGETSSPIPFFKRLYYA